jgi:hypothetical protein
VKLCIGDTASLENWNPGYAGRGSDPPLSAMENMESYSKR